MISVFRMIYSIDFFFRFLGKGLGLRSSVSYENKKQKHFACKLHFRSLNLLFLKYVILFEKECPEISMVLNENKYLHKC